MSEHTETFRLINYRPRNQNGGKVQVGIALGDHIVPLAALAKHHPTAKKLLDASVASELTPGIEGLLTNWEQSFQELSEVAAFVVQKSGEESPWQKESFLLEDVHVLSPILRPTKMIFGGANYNRHLKEAEENWEASGLKNFKGIDKSTAKPYAFIKLPYCIIGPFDPVIYPHPYHQLDWEGELGLVIGRRGKHIPVERAMDHVAGFLLLNDYSLRELNARNDRPGLGPDWVGGKNFDTSACLGPYLVPKDFLPNYLDLRLLLRVNGETKQDCSTQEMVFTPAEFVAFYSSIVTLEPGDVIATGSPPGAGFATGKYLNVGDVVEAQAEGLGRQRNVIIEER